MPDDRRVPASRRRRRPDEGDARGVRRRRAVRRRADRPRARAGGGGAWSARGGVRGDAELSRALRRRDGDRRAERAVHGPRGPHRRAGLPDRRRRSAERPLARTPGTTGPDRTPLRPVAIPAAARRRRHLPRGGGPQRRPTHAGTYDDELALLVVHGMLHVLGMDHAEPDEAAAMQAREREHSSRRHWRTDAPYEPCRRSRRVARGRSCSSPCSAVLATAETGLTHLAPRPGCRRWPTTAATARRRRSSSCSSTGAGAQPGAARACSLCQLVAATPRRRARRELLRHARRRRRRRPRGGRHLRARRGRPEDLGAAAPRARRAAGHAGSCRPSSASRRCAGSPGVLIGWPT